MIWTTSKPTQPGWYWMRPNACCEAFIMEIKKLQDGELVLVRDMPQGDFEYLSECLGHNEWAGPITPPIATSVIRLEEIGKLYKVYFANGVYLGELLVKEDGYYDFWPELRGGCWSEYVLREIADELQRLNKPWKGGDNAI